jgi:hypothetical protein
MKNLYRALINPILLILLSIVSSFSTYDEGKKTELKVFNQFNSPYDTFKANDEGGWSHIQSYVHLYGDSVKFEALLSRMAPNNVDWTTNVMIGKISEEFAPTVRTDLHFREPSRKWALIITPKGKCYARWIAGKMPDHGKMYLSIKTVFRK